MYEYACTVERVVDGDTVDVVLDLGFDILYKCRVRLYGIDTPESRTRNLELKARGLLSKQYLKDKIESADQLVIQTKLKDSRGKFGRVLGSVIADGVDLNEDMIKNHYAVKYYGQDKQDIANAHLHNRSKLIEKGLYSIENYLIK
jgi:micrococcal nuclease|tara:strand:- start:3130 stop:3564 length:435 start_codon:yes stop_codon:yes gene_type:complete